MTPMGTKTAQRDRFLRTAFGITAAEWDQILQYQQGMCPICGKSIRTSPRPHTDHDHKNGKLRGLLCSQCNRALGKAQDPRWAWTPVCFLKAYLYLLNHPAKAALGYQPVGFPGMIGTKRFREWAKKNKRVCV
jgi:hypothetical protein